ncbi:hypothetical protein, partial [Ruixingdingia sedimenti]
MHDQNQGGRKTTDAHLIVDPPMEAGITWLFGVPGASPAWGVHNPSGSCDTSGDPAGHLFLDNHCRQKIEDEFGDRPDSEDYGQDSFSRHSQNMTVAARATAERKT